MEPSRTKRIAETLRTLRRYHGFPQKYLAAQLGISQAAYSKMEHGGVGISGDHLYRFAEVYNLPLVALEDKTADEVILYILEKKTNALSDVLE